MTGLRPALTRRATVVAAVLALGALVVALIVVSEGKGAHPNRGSGAQRTSTGASPPSLPLSVTSSGNARITASCGNPAPASTLGPAPVLPTHPTRALISPAGGIVDFVVGNGRIYVESPTELSIDTLQGTSIGHFSLPADLRSTALNVSSLAVDPQGGIYVSDHQTGVLDKFTPTGRMAWAKKVDHPAGLFSLGKGATFRIAVTPAGAHTSELLDTSGQPAGTVPVTTGTDGYVTETANGDLLVSNAGHVEITNPGGTKVLGEFGSQRIEGNDLRTGGPYQFYYPGQAVQEAGGAIVTADPLTTFEASSSTGVLQATTTLGGHLALAGGYLYEAGSGLYFETGSAFTSSTSVSTMSRTTLDTYLKAPHPAIDRLGWGAGLSTPAAGNYFAPGSTPTAAANFAPWWAANAKHLRLDYSLWTTADLAVKAPRQQSIRLPTSGTGLAHVNLAIPSADRAPGPYEMQASLYDTATSPARLIGSTCLPFTVGAAGDHLDLARLPTGVDAGGASDQRGLELNDELGLNGLRSITNIDWTTFLPGCNASSPTEAQCGAGAMTFAHAPSAYFHAAAEAKRLGITYWIQITGGDPVSAALAHHGWWQADIEKLVAYYSHPPAGCAGCAGVQAWEPWNEPNNTGWSTGGSYVAEVLAPFYRGVRAADPHATVIGGSTLGITPSWWDQLVKAGGLHDLDVASVHPYPGNNDSLEEWGILSQLRGLQRTLGGTPLWITEIGWWGDGDYNVVNQADSIAQAMVYLRALHIPVLNYYYSEGEAPPGSVSFTLIQTSSGRDDYVKAGALATMTTSRQLADRPYLSMPDTGIPSTYEATFGPRPGGGSTDLAAVWSDGLSTNAAVTVTGRGSGAVPVTIVNEWGKSSSERLVAGRRYRLPVGSEVAFLNYPHGDHLSIGPTEPYGPNLALASAGARASASSGQAGGAISPNTMGVGWSSSPHDKAPTLTIDLHGHPTINRIIVDTQSVGSTATGLRDYSVSVESPDGRWSVAARVVGQFRNHREQVTIAPRPARAVRIAVTRINYGGYSGGGIPSFTPAGTPGVAFVHAVQVYGGRASVSDVQGRQLPPLP